MALKLKTAPAIEPITLAEAKAHCRVDSGDEDALISALISAAVSHMDAYSGILGRCLIEQTWEMYYDTFPTGALKIPLGPVTEITSVEYAHPTTGVMTVWASNKYEKDLVSLDAWIVPVDSWPDIMDTTNAVRVTFKAGYGATAASVPASIKAAMLLLVGHWYANREAVTTDTSAIELPLGVAALIAPFRRSAL